jgi:1-acyl-sn-glycerol-3-phosphate acyltransferase
MAASPRPIRFLMDHQIFKIPVLGWMFKLAKAIPIAPAKADPATYEAAFAAARAVLADGEMVCIFPEGGITRDGELQPFKGGVMKLIDGLPDVPVIPMALGNLWGSYFSRVEGGKAMVKPMRRGFWSRISLTVDQPLKPADVTPDVLRERVAGLLATPST